MKKTCMLVGVLSVVVAVLPQASFAQSREDGFLLFKEANALHEKAQTNADLKQAIQNYQQALNIFDRVGFKRGIGATSDNLGNICIRLSQYDKALEYYEKSLAIYRELKDRKNEGSTLNNLGAVFWHMGGHGKAVEYYQESLEIFRELNDRSGQAKSVVCLGLVFSDCGQYEKAMHCYELSLPVYRELKDRDGEGATLNNLGEVFRYMGQYEKAVESYERSFAIFRELKNRSGEGTALNNLGLVYREWGQYDKAMEYFGQDLTICQKLGNRMGEGTALANLGGVFSDWDQYDKAVQYYEKSLAIFRDLKNRTSEGTVLGNLGMVYERWGLYDKAAAYFEQALAICREFKNLRGEGRALNNLGLVYKEWGQYDKAVEYYEKSLAISTGLKDRKGEGSTLNELANVFSDRGLYGQAVAYYNKSLAICRELKDRKGEGSVSSNLGIVFAYWGQYDGAMECFTQNLGICREFKNRKGEISALSNMGNVFSDWGQYDKAVEYYEKSLAICRELKDRKAEGQSLMNVGRVQLDRGDSQKALDHFQRGLSIYMEIKLPTGWPKALMADSYMHTGDLARAEPLLKEANHNNRWGRYYLLKADFPRAKEYYGKILKSAEENRNAGNLFTAYTGLGAACEGLKDDAGAMEHYEKAVKHTEEIRSSLSASEREKFFDVKINGFTRTVPYEGLARVQFRQNKPQEAFKTTEYTRARVFAEAMSRMFQGKTLNVRPDIVKQDESTNNQLASLKKNLQKAYEKNNKLVIQTLAPQVKEKESKLQAHIKMLREKYPLFAATKYPQPMDLSQTALNDSEWVLSYDMTDSGLIIYLAKGRTLVKSLFKPIPRKKVDDLVRKFREPLEVKEGRKITDQLKKFDFASGKKLADLLLSDILSVLPKDEPVIVIPGGSLGIVPFEMLVLNDGGKIATDKERPYVTGAEFFGDRNPISYYQSVTALTLARTFGKQKGSGEKRLVMDDPIFDTDDSRFKQIAREKKQTDLSAAPDKLLSAIKHEWKKDIVFPRLEGTRDLGDALKKMEPNRTEEYRDMQATKSVLFEKPLDRYSSMVFATHGYFGKDLPGIMEPVLVLTLVNQPAGKDGYLRLSEVMGLKLNADLVALTACQTGLGKHISGEGTMGMGRAFQYAGAKSVLMSLWSVSEAGSVKLVESFFKHLKGGKNKLEALKLARDEIRKEGYDHPFYWAPFILIGEVN